jgi:hypothetical protein
MTNNEFVAAYNIAHYNITSHTYTTLCRAWMAAMVAGSLRVTLLGQIRDSLEEQYDDQ